MSNYPPSPASLFRVLRLCFLLLVYPQRISDQEPQDNVLRMTLIAKSESPTRAHTVRRAFFDSFALVAASGAIGYGFGLLMGAAGRCATASTVAWLQIAGASVLLWGTLFVRGWEVQTYDGKTLTERVNQWLYRGLYCIGTALVVYSLAFPGCRQGE